MSSWPILSLVTFLPIVGTVLILMLRGEPAAVARNARYLALWTSLITFLLSLVLWFGFDRSSGDFQFMEQADWIPAFGIHYKMGVDGIWGGERRVYSAFKFFLYTLLGSVLMLLVLVAMNYFAGTTDIPTLMHHGFPVEIQRWLWLGLLASFSVKVPMWPVHTWLPDAHVEAPTAGSVILAGVLLKLGAYGFLRFSVPMLPEASAYFTPLIYVLSAVAVVYTSLVALA